MQEEENKCKPIFQEMKFDCNTKGEISSIRMVNIPDISQSDKGKLNSIYEMLDDLEEEMGYYDGEENWISSKYAESHIHPLKEIVKELLKGLET